MGEDENMPIMGVRLIAAELGFTAQQVRHFNKSGELPTTRLGSRVTTTRRLLREWRAGVEDRARRELAARQGGNGRTLAALVSEHVPAKADGGIAG